MPIERATAMEFDVQGHRGARGLMPENTIPAFQCALELGVTTLEMDAVIARDGTVVVSHEPWFSEVTCLKPNGEAIEVGEAQQLRIYAMTYDEVVRYDCGSRPHPRFPEQRKMPIVKPRLRDVIEMAEAYVREHDLSAVCYNVETKSTPAGDGVFHPGPDAFTRALYGLLLATGVKDRSTIQSFDVRTLHVARSLDPSWRTSLLVEYTPDHHLDAALSALDFVPDVYSPDFRLVDASLVREVHDCGMQLIPWTVNDPADMQRLRDLGVDGLITDYPDRVM